MSKTNSFSEANREFASFGGACPFNCLHCYTFSNAFQKNNLQDEGESSIENIINRLKKTQFSIIYVSGYKENFVNPDDGLDLLEALFFEFKCHILFTTRNVFDSQHILRLSSLNKLMKEASKNLFACVSISAHHSYKKLELNDIIPPPEMRIEFLKQLYENDIVSFLTLRPICPNQFIPTQEYLEIIEKSYKFCAAVIASGIYVDDYVIERLKTFPEDCERKSKDWSCFGDIVINHIDVSKELSEIEDYCNKKNILFFKESIPAINHFRVALPR